MAELRNYTFKWGYSHITISAENASRRLHISLKSGTDFMSIFKTSCRVSGRRLVLSLAAAIGRLSLIWCRRAIKR